MPDSLLSAEALNTLNWNAEGLIAAIVQDAATGDVLMMAWMNHESLIETLNCGETVFYSRSRQKLWHKGETSGHTQRVTEIRVDCDADTLLIRVEAAGPACHTGKQTCFFRTLSDFNQKPERL